MNKKIFLIIILVVVNIFVSFWLAYSSLKFSIMFDGLEVVPLPARIFIFFTTYPSFMLTNLFCKNCLFFAVYPVLAISAMQIFLFLIFTTILFHLIIKSIIKKHKEIILLAINLFIIFILFVPLLLYGNLYSENNYKPKMVYCFQNTYLSNWHSYKEIKKDVGFENCLHDSVYGVIDRQLGFVSEKSFFDLSKVKKYCSRVSDNPLPDNIKKFNSVSTSGGYGETIKFDGYKFLSQRDICFASFAWEVWPSGEFSWQNQKNNYSNNNQLKICESVPTENNRRDYCFYYVIIKKIASDSEKRDMCRLIIDNNLKTTCLTRFGAQGNTEEGSGDNFNTSNLEARFIYPTKIFSQGDVQELSKRVVLTKNILDSDGSAFFHSSINTNEKDMALKVQYRFINTGDGDQFGIWIDDQMKFISTGNIVGANLQEAIIDISKLKPGSHILSLILHSFNDSSSPAQIEIGKILILSL